MNDPRRTPVTWLAALLSERPAFVAVALAVVLALVGAFAPRVQIVAGVEPFFDRSRPEQRTIDALNAAFANDDVVLVAWQSADVFAPAALAGARALEAALAALTVPGADGERPAFTKTHGLATVKDVDGGDGTFRSVPLVPDPLPEPDDTEAFARIRRRAHGNPLIRDALVAADDRTAAIVLELGDKFDDEQKAQVVARVRDVARTFQQGALTSVHVAGEVVVQVDTAAFMRTDLGRFIPIVYAILLVMVFWFSRNLAVVALGFANATLSLLVGVACIVATGANINNTSTILPPVTVVLSIASLVHVVTELHEHRRSHPDLAPRAVMFATFAGLLGATFVCDVTTAVGFFSLATAHAPAVREFGVAAGLTVLLCFVAQFLLFAAVLHVFGVERFALRRPGGSHSVLERGLQRVIALVERHRWGALGLAAGLCVVFFVGAQKIRVDQDNIGFFDPNEPVRVATTLVDTDLGGTLPLVLSVKHGAEEALIEPDALRRLDAFCTAAKKLAGIRACTSPADFLKLMNRGFNDGDPAQYAIPPTRAHVAQLLLMNGDDTLDDVLHPDHRWARVVLRSDAHSSAVMRTVLDGLDGLAATHLPAALGYQTEVAGQSKLWVLMAENLIEDQSTGFSVSFFLIFIPIAVAFRSLRAGFYSIPSNVFPILCMFGLMGVFGIPLSLSTANISSIVLGIAVDDTTHFISAMRDHIRRHDDPPRAVRDTMRTKGFGALWITLIISVGFSSLAASSFASTRDFGLLCAVAMGAGVIAELLVLPPLLLVTGTRLGIPRTPTSGVVDGSPR